MSKKSFVISMLGLAVLMGPAFGSSCTSASNPCTGTSSNGPDAGDRTTFNGDTLNTADGITFSNIDFATITAGNYSAGGLSNAMTDGVTFTGVDSNGSTPDLYVANVASWGAQVLEQHNNGGTITATISGGNVYAFGVDLIYLAGTPEWFSISVNGGAAMTSATEPGDTPASVFFGYTSATPITSVTITPLLSSDQQAIANFEIGQEPAPTPEVGTLLLIGTGLILMRVMHRRQKSASTKADRTMHRPLLGISREVAGAAHFPMMV
jgi:hypothetical protein